MSEPETRTDEESSEAGLAEAAAACPGFDAAYREHAQAIHYLCLRFLGDDAQAQDAAHDVFVKAWRKWGTFRGESAIRTWLYRIAINHCQNIRQSWHARNVFSNADEAVWETTPGNASENPLRVLEVRELGGRIQKALDSMPEEHRLLLLLVADEKLAYEEVAQLTGQTTDAVRGKLHRARKAFATAFASTA